MKKTVKQNIKKTISIAKKALLIILILSAIFIPFMSGVLDKTVAQVIWYPSFLIFIIDGIRFVKKGDKISNIDFLNYLSRYSLLPLAVLISSAFIINYYVTSYTWWWGAFVLVATAIPSFVLAVRAYNLEQKSHTDDEIKKSNIFGAKLIAFYLLLDLLYMSIFMYWQSADSTRGKWLVWQFIFGIIAILIIFCNLTQVFLKSEKKNMFFMLQDFIVGIAITIYLIFVIPDEALRNIVLTIIAAVISGLITLVGVAWTIRDSSIKRAEDFKRAEEERKEDERKRNIPYVRFCPEGTNLDLRVRTYIMGWPNLRDPKIKEQISTHKLKNITINSFCIKNISNTNILLKGLSIYDKSFNFTPQELLEPGSVCLIKIDGSLQGPFDIGNLNVFITLSDALENEYKIKCNVSRERRTGSYAFSEDVDGVEYRTFNYPLVVDSMGLPVLVTSEF